MKNKLKKLAILIATTLSLSAVAFEAAAANIIVGGWHLKVAATNSPNVAGTNSVLMFLNDGTYFHIKDSTTETGGTNGMEYGTYSYNEAASQISFNTLIDTNGGWGANSIPSANFTFTDENSLVASGGSAYAYSRITSDSNPIVGSWLYGGGGIKVVLSFLEDGTFFSADYIPSPNEWIWSGMERGNYTFNQNTGALDITSVQVDTNGDWGFAINGALKNDNKSFIGTFLNHNTVNSINSADNSTVTLTRIAAVPEADTSAMLLMGAGVMGFIARRRKQAAA